MAAERGRVKGADTARPDESDAHGNKVGPRTARHVNAFVRTIELHDFPSTIHWDYARPVPKPGVDPTVPLELSVDRSSPVPLYFQLSQQLEAAIETGRSPPAACWATRSSWPAGSACPARPSARPSSRSSTRACWCAAGASAPRSCTARSSAPWSSAASTTTWRRPASARPPGCCSTPSYAASAEVAAALGRRRGQRGAA